MDQVVSNFNVDVVKTLLVIVVIAGGIFIYKKRPFSMSGLGSTQTLDLFASDLTALARKKGLDPVIGRDEEISRVIQILSRRTKNNVILLGQPGVGKTAIVEGLAQRIISGEIPELLSHKRLLLLQVSELLAGTKYRGDFEQRIKVIVNEIRRSGRRIILFIDEIHTVTQTKGTEGAVNLSDILKPALARGDLQLIGATSRKEYEEYIRADESWDRRFQVVIVDEPTLEESIAILQGLKQKYEEYHHVTITDEAIRAAVRLSQEYIKGRRLPDKAIDIMDETAAKVNVERGSEHEHAAALLHHAAKRVGKNTSEADTPSVTDSDIKEVVGEWVDMKPDEIH